MRMILLLCVSFLILSGCASAPKPTTFDAAWSFIDLPDERRACLGQADVDRLREVLIRCEGK